MDRVMYVDYARESPKLPPVTKVKAEKGWRAVLRFFPNAGTIVNTSPRLSRNTIVSVDGGKPTKLKRTVLAGRGLPYTVINNRRPPKPEKDWN